MKIEYQTRKDLPCNDLYRLFVAVGWAKTSNTTQTMIDKFNIGFLNSTFVFSAWDGDKLVGCIRVLSDLHFRSIIYDLAILPEYQHQGIGSMLVKKCIESCPNSEWLVQTDQAKEFYQKIGFQSNYDDFLFIPCKWF